jgi:ABC-type phosphate transport system ATPase subunit
MQIVDLVGQILQSGKVTVFTNNVKDAEINIANKRIDVNAVNKEFIKDTIASIRKGEKSEGISDNFKGSISVFKKTKNTIDMFKDVAEELSDAGITVTLSYEGDTVLTIGSGANSKILSLATGTKSIEINSARKLIELGI